MTHRPALPQLADRLFLTDGGLETTLIFHDGLELPDFAAFHLLADRAGEDALRRYFSSYAGIAQRFGTGLVLETATWRANPDWGERLGYRRGDLAAANRQAVRLLEEIRDEYARNSGPVVISGCVGPRGDGYVASQTMSAQEAADYHAEQLDTFAGTSVDMACAITMTYAEEAIGIAHAARQSGLPVAISFTVETDGRLPTGQPLAEAIGQVDAATSRYPSYYMINCAHPTHFGQVLTEGGDWIRRIRGLRANASCRSHAELNEAPDLDAGDPVELARQYTQLKALLPQLNVLGGCCGTDHRHIEQIAVACVPLFRTRAVEEESGSQ